MVRAFLSIITIIHHPSSIIILAITSIGQKRRFGDYFFGDKGVLRETFFFFLLLTLFCTFVCFVFMQLIFNTWFSPFLRTHNEIGPRMWFPFSVFIRKYIFSNGVLILFSVIKFFYLSWRFIERYEYSTAMLARGTGGWADEDLGGCLVGWLVSMWGSTVGILLTVQ